MPRRRLEPPVLQKPREAFPRLGGPAPVPEAREGSEGRGKAREGAPDELERAASLLQRELGGVEITPDPEWQAREADLVDGSLRVYGGERDWSRGEARRYLLAIQMRRERNRKMGLGNPATEYILRCPRCLQLQTGTGRRAGGKWNCYLCPISCPDRWKHKAKARCPACTVECEPIWATGRGVKNDEMPEDW